MTQSSPRARPSVLPRRSCSLKILNAFRACVLRVDRRGMLLSPWMQRTLLLPLDSLQGSHRKARREIFASSGKTQCGASDVYTAAHFIVISSGLPQKRTALHRIG